MRVGEEIKSITEEFKVWYSPSEKIQELPESCNVSSQTGSAFGNRNQNNSRHLGNPSRTSESCQGSASGGLAATPNCNNVVNARSSGAKYDKTKGCNGNSRQSSTRPIFTANRGAAECVSSVYEKCTDIGINETKSGQNSLKSYFNRTNNSGVSRTGTPTGTIRGGVKVVDCKSLKYISNQQSNSSCNTTGTDPILWNERSILRGAAHAQSQTSNDKLLHETYSSSNRLGVKQYPPTKEPTAYFKQLPSCEEQNTSSVNVYRAGFTSGTMQRGNRNGAGVGASNRNRNGLGKGGAMGNDSTKSMGNSMGKSMGNSMGKNVGKGMGSSMGNNGGNTRTNTMGNSRGNVNSNGRGNGTRNGMDNRMGNDVGNNTVNCMCNCMCNGMGNGMGNGMRNGRGNGMGSDMGNGRGNGMGNGRGYGMGNGRGNGMGNGRGNGMGNGMGSAISNCMSNGMGNGMGNSMGKGMGNGMSNGMSNSMLKGMGNGMGNSMGNGMSNGMSNGMLNGMGNGMGNSMGNGMSNGMLNSMGNSMGNGMGNGMSNSMGNGMGNGMDSGMGNGMGRGSDINTQCTTNNPPPHQMQQLNQPITERTLRPLPTQPQGSRSRNDGLLMQKQFPMPNEYSFPGLGVGGRESPNSRTATWRQRQDQNQNPNISYSQSKPTSNHRQTEPYNAVQIGSFHYRTISGQTDQDAPGRIGSQFWRRNQRPSILISEHVQGQQARFVDPSQQFHSFAQSQAQSQPQQSYARPQPCLLDNTSYNNCQNSSDPNANYSSGGISAHCTPKKSDSASMPSAEAVLLSVQKLLIEAAKTLVCPSLNNNNPTDQLKIQTPSQGPQQQITSKFVETETYSANFPPSKLVSRGTSGSRACSGSRGSSSLCRRTRRLRKRKKSNVCCQSSWNQRDLDGCIKLAEEQLRQQFSPKELLQLHKQLQAQGQGNGGQYDQIPAQQPSCVSPEYIIKALQAQLASGGQSINFPNNPNGVLLPPFIQQPNGQMCFNPLLLQSLGQQGQGQEKGQKQNLLKGSSSSSSQFQPPNSPRGGGQKLQQPPGKQQSKTQLQPQGKKQPPGVLRNDVTMRIHVPPKQKGHKQPSGQNSGSPAAGSTRNLKTTSSQNIKQTSSQQSVSFEDKPSKRKLKQQTPSDQNLTNKSSSNQKLPTNSQSKSTEQLLQNLPGSKAIVPPGMEKLFEKRQSKQQLSQGLPFEQQQRSEVSTNKQQVSQRPSKKQQLSQKSLSNQQISQKSKSKQQVSLETLSKERNSKEPPSKQQLPQKSKSKQQIPQEVPSKQKQIGKTPSKQMEFEKTPSKQKQSQKTLSNQNQSLKMSSTQKMLQESPSIPGKKSNLKQRLQAPGKVKSASEHQLLLSADVASELSVPSLHVARKDVPTPTQNSSTRQSGQTYEQTADLEFQEAECQTSLFSASLLEELCGELPEGLLAEGNDTTRPNKRLCICNDNGARACRKVYNPQQQKQKRAKGPCLNPEALSSKYWKPPGC